MRRLKKKEKKIFNIPFKIKAAVVALAVLFVVGVVFFMSSVGKEFLKTGEDVKLFLSEQSGLTLENVEVAGHARTTIQDINKKINLAQGMSIFDVDLVNTRMALLTLPWVKSVVVERHLPDTLYIQIKEKTPIAVWQNNQKYWPVDEDGQVINDDKTPLGSMLLVVGRDALLHVLELVSVLDHYPDIRDLTRSAIRIGDRRWDLMLNDLDNGLLVQLPETDIAHALERISRMNEKEGILKKDLRLIDVRLPDRFIVQAALAPLDLKKGKK